MIELLQQKSEMAFNKALTKIDMNKESLLNYLDSVEEQYKEFQKF